MPTQECTQLSTSLQLPPQPFGGQLKGDHGAQGSCAFSHQEASAGQVENKTEDYFLNIEVCVLFSLCFSVFCSVLLREGQDRRRKVEWPWLWLPLDSHPFMAQGQLGNFGASGLTGKVHWSRSSLFNRMICRRLEGIWAEDSRKEQVKLILPG